MTGKRLSFLLRYNHHQQRPSTCYYEVLLWYQVHLACIILVRTRYLPGTPGMYNTGTYQVPCTYVRVLACSSLLGTTAVVVPGTRVPGMILVHTVTDLLHYNQDKILPVERISDPVSSKCQNKGGTQRKVVVLEIFRREGSI